MERSEELERSEGLERSEELERSEDLERSEGLERSEDLERNESLERMDVFDAGYPLITDLAANSVPDGNQSKVVLLQVLYSRQFDRYRVTS